MYVCMCVCVEYEPFGEVGEGGEDGEGEEVAVDAEDNLADADVEGDLGDDMVAGIEDLDQHHGRVRPAGLPTTSHHHRLSQMPKATETEARTHSPTQKKFKKTINFWRLASQRSRMKWKIR